MLYSCAMSAVDDDPPPPPPPPPGGAGGTAKLAAIAMGIGVAALAGWAIYDAMGDERIAPPDDEDFPPLPTPAEPSTRAMVSSGGGVGWTWVNPRPMALPTLYAVDTSDAGERALFVGVGGAALRYADDGLFAIDTGTDAALRGVAWTGGGEAIAVGDRGTILRMEADAVRPIEAGVEVDLRAVAATGEGQATAVGDGGTVLEVDASGARLVAIGTEVDLMAVFARGPDRFVAGAGGTIVRIGEDGPVVEPTPVSRALRGIGGCPSGSVYAVGDRGALLRRLADGTWRALRGPEGESFTAVSCDHGRVAAVTTAGRVLLLSGDGTVELPSGFDRVWHGVDGATEGRSWLVGIGGRLATIEQDHVRTRTAGPTYPLRALGAMGGALLGVGEWGKVIQQTEGGFGERESPTEAGLAALLQLAEGRALAVGDYGAIVDIRHDVATLVPSPTEASLRGVVGDADGLMMVGAGGIVLRGRLDGLRANVVPDVGDLHGLAGDASSAIAVGDGGAVLRLDERGFARVPCDVGVTLRAVGRWPIGAWAVGDDGVIVRVHESSCVVERRGGPALHAVGLGPEGRPMAVGDDGTSLVRGEDGSWGPSRLVIGTASLRAVYRSSSHVYVAGTGGVMARHILLDGT